MENREERKKFLKVLQGGLPTIQEIRKLLPQQLKNLKQRILQVEDIKLQGIEETIEQIIEIELEYGENLKYLYEFQDSEVLELYRIINNKQFTFFIEQAEQIKEHKKLKKQIKQNDQKALIKCKEKNIGKEPGE